MHTMLQRVILMFIALVLCAGLLAQPVLAGHENVVLIATLDGREEVANNASDRRLAGDPNGRGVAYVFGIDADAATLCYLILVEKIQLVPVGSVGEGMAAHIHEAPRGENGPVVVGLAGPENGNSADCVVVGADLVDDILSNPSEYYVNVHNVRYPGGAVRGQLENSLE